MPESGQGELHHLPLPAGVEDQPSAADWALEASEIRLNQALEQLDRQPEHRAYTLAVERLDGAKIDYEKAWHAFLHTPEGRHYNESNQRHQSASGHYRRVLAKVSGTYHFEKYAAAQSRLARSTQAVEAAREQAADKPKTEDAPDPNRSPIIDPQNRSPLLPPLRTPAGQPETNGRQQIEQQHQSALDELRHAWHDLSHTLEGKDYHRAQIQIDRARNEVGLAWDRGRQTPQGEALARIMEQITQLERECQQAEQAYKQTPAYAEYTEAAEEHRRLTLIAQSEAPPAEPAKIIPIEEPTPQSKIHSVRGMSAAA